jgi:hypothetical protein
MDIDRAAYQVRLISSVIQVPDPIRCHQRNDTLLVEETGDEGEVEDAAAAPFSAMPTS